jgi:hypothetical protein
MCSREKERVERKSCVKEEIDFTLNCVINFHQFSPSLAHSLTPARWQFERLMEEKAFSLLGTSPFPVCSAIREVFIIPLLPQPRAMNCCEVLGTTHSEQRAG